MFPFRRRESAWQLMLILWSTAQAVGRVRVKRTGVDVISKCVRYVAETVSGV